MTVEDWKHLVVQAHAGVKFTLEDGSGLTYGEEGDWTATIEPHDMQANVVGIFNVEDDYWSVNA